MWLTKKRMMIDPDGTLGDPQGTSQKQTANKTDVTRPGKRTKSDIENGHRNSEFSFMNSMVIFHSSVNVYQRVQ